MAADPGRTPNPPSEQLSDAAPAGTNSSNPTQRCRGQGACRGQPQDQSRTIKFEGQCEELSGHVYVNPCKATDQFAKTTREVCEYIGHTYTYGEDTKIALETLSRPTLAMPEDPADDATQTEKKIWEERVKQYMWREDTLVRNLKSAYALIYGQCSDTLWVKLESRPVYEMIKGRADPIGLFENIRAVMYQFQQAEWYGPLALHKAKCHYYTFFQDKHMTCQQYYESFKNNADVLEYAGGALGQEPGLIDAELLAVGVVPDAADEEQIATAEAAAKERVLAIGLLVGSNCGRYGKLLEDLENDFTQG